MSKWKTVRLGEICSLNMGQSPKSDTYNNNGVGMPFFQGNADFGAINPNINHWCSEPVKIANVDDILISVRAPVGALNIANFKCCIGRGLASITVDKSIAERNFIWYMLKSKIDELQSKSNGSTFKAINKTTLYDVTFPLPPLEIQKQIASSLDKVTYTIDLCNQIIEKLDLLVKARFVEMFGDPVLNTRGYQIKLLSDIAEYRNGLTYKPDNVSENGIIVLRSSNIQNSQLDFSDVVRVNCKIDEKKYVKPNDILMCSRNGSARLVGKVALIKKSKEPMCFGAFMMIIRSKYYYYLMTYFQMPAFREQIATSATTTINQITVNMLNNISLPIPPLNEITLFDDFVRQTEKSKSAVKQVLEKAEILKKSLMQEYFK